MGKFLSTIRKPLPRLDDVLPTRVRVILLILASLVPTIYVAKHYDPPPHFSKLIFFGRNKAALALPEVNALKLERDSVAGYDAQFYAQVAIHPLLTDPHMKTALDMPPYRSRRILLPAMAYLLGLGNPRLILEAYALLNLVFWFALLFGMVRYLKAESPRDYLCIFAAVFTTGSMVSLERALTDMPACTLLFYSAALGATAATGALMLAVLARETSALCLVRFAWPLPQSPREWLVLAGRTAIVLAPMVLWVAYITHVFGKANNDTHPFVAPFAGWIKYMQNAWFNFTHVTWQIMPTPPLLSWSEALRHPGKQWSRIWWHVRPYIADTTNQERVVFELIAPLSLLAQAIYFACFRSLQSPYWRLGVIFSIMMICMNTSEEQVAYCRAVLPVTLAFNIELRQARGWTFALFFLAGNLGLMWGFRDALAYCLFK